MAENARGGSFRETSEVEAGHGLPEGVAHIAREKRQGGDEEAYWYPFELLKTYRRTTNNDNEKRRVFSAENFAAFVWFAVYEDY